jgi:hypothetical protein
MRSFKNSKAKFSFLVSSILLAGFLRAAEAPHYPLIISELTNPNGYTLFANGGWDGNWYVGYNNTWVKKLPALPKGNYSRAFIGARLGRAKTLPPVGRPPEFKPIPGEVWAAVASTPAWSARQQVRLATTEDIPLEPGTEYALDHVGESQWYWAEVPLDALNFLGENFLAVWSPSPAFVSIASSPVLAAGWGGKDAGAWLLENRKGVPPQNPNYDRSKGLSYFHPALAVKLIPAGPAPSPKVRIVSFRNGTPEQPKPVVTVSVEGESIQRVWIEHNEPARRGDIVRGNWIQVGRSIWKAPYIFSIELDKLPKGRLFLRAAASNFWEEKAFSPSLEIEVDHKPIVK